MPEAELLTFESVRINSGWLDRKRARISCSACGEGINYQREVLVGGRVVCRACSGANYYSSSA
jgi:formylmethanofuran dehydrogenase subunit E